MAEKSVPIHEVAYMLEHESIQTTKKYYTEVLVDNLREKINTTSQISVSTADSYILNKLQKPLSVIYLRALLWYKLRGSNSRTAD